MKTAIEIYGDESRYWSDYTPMLEGIGEVLLQVDDEDCRGDSRVLYRDGNRIGYLKFGWGGCPGCDALQACDTIQEVQALMDELRDGVMWFDNARSALEWFNAHDWEGNYRYDSKQMEFIRKAKEIFLAQ